MLMAVDGLEGNTRTIDLQQYPNQPQNPALQKSWDVIIKEMDAHDDGLVKGCKEDIDPLLVFAGLFSAIVTGFTIKSYKWLSEDSADTTVVLLRQISRQLDGQASSEFEPLRFTPGASSIRINAFWFLSLILSLMDALFGLLCKQWLREHLRQASTRMASEALTLRWFRNKSFERWGVPEILATLPILLEIALFFFFVGLLDLLWSRHHIPLTVAMTVVGCAVSFYLATTIALESISYAKHCSCILLRREDGPLISSFTYLQSSSFAPTNLRSHGLCSDSSRPFPASQVASSLYGFFLPGDSTCIRHSRRTLSSSTRRRICTTFQIGLSWTSIWFEGF
ncbi:hypothetical protein L218DRAFT_492143 [Marasmius fiardii PR-910]|nr:hypothetical protein L218DRAFT_492143 [Marasmius fiardii PR-910]